MPDRSEVDRDQLLALVTDSGVFYQASAGPARVRGNTAITRGWIAPMSTGPRPPKESARLNFRDTWKKRGEKWLLVATVIRKR